MKHMLLGVSALLASLPLTFHPAFGQEISTYSYDVQGRLITAFKTGGPNSGVATSIAYDAADNRSLYAVTQGNATLSISDATGNEGGPLTFTVTRTGAVTSAISAAWSTSNGSAIAGTNFTASNGTVSFPAGVTSASIIVPTIRDHVITPNITMSVALSSPSSGVSVGSPGSVTGTIVNIDAGWSSALTAGSVTKCISLGSFGTICIPFVGFEAGVGAMSNVSYSGSTISVLGTVYGTSFSLTMAGATAPANSGWTSLTVPGVGMLQRSAATYSGSGTSASWTWTVAPNLTSGTVVIQ